jgi:DNA-3-methyladenine glycosylase I
MQIPLLKPRCHWAKNVPDFYKKYHDKEWGVPLHNDKKLFEMLILEGAQAGLSWQTILQKRDNYKKAFYSYDIKKISKMTDSQLNKLLTQKENPIIRNRLKIYSVRKNALAFLKIQKEFGSFDKYIWNFVNNKPIINHPKTMSEIPAFTKLSEKISKDLKKRGFSFVGKTIIYAFMQAIGMVNDHEKNCFCKN